MNTPADRSGLERHVQTLISLGIAALIGWAGMTLQDMQTSIASMSVQIQQLQTEVTNLRQLNNDRYPQTQASQDWARNRQELDEIRARLRAVERVVK